MPPNPTTHQKARGEWTTFDPAGCHHLSKADGDDLLLILTVHAFVQNGWCIQLLDYYHLKVPYTSPHPEIHPIRPSTYSITVLHPSEMAFYFLVWTKFRLVWGQTNFLSKWNPDFHHSFLEYLEWWTPHRCVPRTPPASLSYISLKSEIDPLILLLPPTFKQDQSLIGGRLNRLSIVALMFHCCCCCCENRRRWSGPRELWA